MPLVVYLVKDRENNHFHFLIPRNRRWLLIASNKRESDACWLVATLHMMLKEKVAFLLGITF